MYVSIVTGESGRQDTNACVANDFRGMNEISPELPVNSAVRCHTIKRLIVDSLDMSINQRLAIRNTYAAIPVLKIEDILRGKIGTVIINMERNGSCKRLFDLVICSFEFFKSQYLFL